MSLQSMIYRINNSLISGFAVLDSWCDRDASFLFRKRKTGSSPFDLMQEVLISNDYFLSVMNMPQPDEATSFYEGFVADANTGLMNVPALHKIEWLARINEPSVHTFRLLMREQLFNLLCMLDELHNSMLDATDVSNCVANQRRVKMLKNLADAMVYINRDFGEELSTSTEGINEFECM